MQNQTTHHKGKQEDRQAGRQEGRPAERQAGRQGRQNLGKADTPSNTGKQEGRHWETKGETKPREGGRTIQHRTLQAHMWGNNGRQGETRPWEVGHTVQHRHTCEETMRDKGRQDVEKADTPSNKGKQEGRWERRGNKTSGRRTHHPTQADKRRQRGKADTPRLRHHPRQAHMCGDKWETKREDKTSKRRTIQHRHKCGQTMGDNGREGETRPPQAHMWGDNGREWGTMGDTWRPGRQDLEKAGTPSKKGKQEGRWETMEDDKER